MIQFKNANAVIALDSPHAATTFEPLKKESRMNMGWSTLIELLHTPSPSIPW